MKDDPLQKVTNIEKVQAIERLITPLTAVVAIAALEDDPKLAKLVVAILKRLDTYKAKYQDAAADIEREQFKSKNGKEVS